MLPIFKVKISDSLKVVPFGFHSVLYFSKLSLLWFMHAALFDQICEAFDINVLEVEDFCTPVTLLLNMRFIDTMLILFEVSYFIV